MSLLASLFVLASPLVGLTEPTCAKGDVVAGPNCVHVDWVRAPQELQAHSVVYRPYGNGVEVVWAGFGEVALATEQELHTVERGENDEGVEGLWSYRYKWDGSRYSGRTAE